MCNVHKYCVMNIILVSIDVNDLYPLVTHDTHVKMSTRGNCSSQSSVRVNERYTIEKL